MHHVFLVVPGAGLEPAHLAAGDFEIIASKKIVLIQVVVCCF